MMIQEHLEEERDACATDVEEMRRNEEALHQQQPLDQVENNYYNSVFVLRARIPTTALSVFWGFFMKKLDF